ncbi:MAG TPA: hypothetical protein DCE41_27740, partial [Cytophagales bacterium]|nr:hypothetical protein [Cytophagales bacterium]
MEELIYPLLSANGYRSATKEQLRSQLQSHPHYPSLKACTDTLDYFGIENLAVSLPQDQWEHVPGSFLAQIKPGPDPEFLVLVSKKDGEVKYRSETGSWQKATTEQFLDLWTGVLIAVEENDGSSAPVSQSKAWTLLGFLSLTALVAIAPIRNFDWVRASYAFLTLLGGGIVYAIASTQLQKSTWLGKQVCSTGEKAQEDACDQVINNPTVSLPLGLTFTDGAVIYFATLVGSLAFVGYQSGTMQVLSWLTLPVVVLSWYHQGVTLKKWCKLCLALSLVLLAQSAILLFQGFPSFSLPYAASLAGIFVLVAWGWQTRKQLGEKVQAGEKHLQDLLRFKRHSAALQILKQHPRVSTRDFQVGQVMVFGQPQGEFLRLTTVINPLCGYCKGAFQSYQKLLDSPAYAVRLQMLLLVPEATEHPATQVAISILQQYQKDPQLGWQAIKDWFQRTSED